MYEYHVVLPLQTKVCLKTFKSMCPSGHQPLVSRPLVLLSSGEPGLSLSSHWARCSPSACCFTPWGLITPRCRRPSLNVRSILMSRWTISAELTGPPQEVTANGGPGGSDRTILTRRIKVWLPWHPQTLWLSGRWSVQPLKSKLPNVCYGHPLPQDPSRARGSGQ